MARTDFVIVGAGLAGCECALTLAARGFSVTLFEQKPVWRSPAHVSDSLAELVCSNSLRSNELVSAIGILKAEMRLLGSKFMHAADSCAIPAGKALAVDREKFSRCITEMILSQPLINLVQRRIDSLDDSILESSDARATVVAAGPLASDGLAASLADMAGQKHCYFYDAIAPIVWRHSLDMNRVFRASRYEQTDGQTGDYLNCPFSREEYERFYAALCAGKTFKAQHDDAETHFEGCMPIEALAARGPSTLTFGPFKPVGLKDPATGQRPYAVLQLRPEQGNMETCNLVGCQTKLLQEEQKRIFRLVPGLENAEFARYGSMHRNTYLNSPEVLDDNLALKARPNIFLAGQISGVEGYVESAASGLWLGLWLASRARGRTCSPPPPETALGALLGHLRRPTANFQPSNAHFGLMPELQGKIKKRERKGMYSSRAQAAFDNWLQSENGRIFF